MLLSTPAIQAVAMWTGAFTTTTHMIIRKLKVLVWRMWIWKGKRLFLSSLLLINIYIHTVPELSSVSLKDITAVFEGNPCTNHFTTLLQYSSL